MVNILKISGWAKGHIRNIVNEIVVEGPIFEGRLVERFGNEKRVVEGWAVKDMVAVIKIGSSFMYG